MTTPLTCAAVRSWERGTVRGTPKQQLALSRWSLLSGDVASLPTDDTGRMCLSLADERTCDMVTGPGADAAAAAAVAAAATAADTPDSYVELVQPGAFAVRVSQHTCHAELQPFQVRSVLSRRCCTLPERACLHSTMYSGANRAPPPRPASSARSRGWEARAP